VLRYKHIGGVGVETLEFPQQAQLRTSQGMFGGVSALHSMHIEIPGFEIDLVPPQGYEFGRAESMAKHQQNNRRIADPMAPGRTRRLHHRGHLIRSQIVSYGIIASLFPGRSST
jgi:hypothetical protein